MRTIIIINSISIQNIQRVPSIDQSINNNKADLMEYAYLGRNFTEEELRMAIE